MEMKNLLIELTNQGVTLRAVRGDGKILASRCGGLTDEIRQLILAHKPLILLYLVDQESPYIH